MLPESALRGDYEDTAARQRALLQIAKRTEEEQRLDERYRVTNEFACSNAPGGGDAPVDLSELNRRNLADFKR